jgi:hypothetical protein
LKPSRPAGRLFIRNTFLFRNIGLTFVFLFLLLSLRPAEAPSAEFNQGTGFRIETKRWPEAERLFRSDPRWLGGDGASSVDLKWGRVLWLFGDSFINEAGTRTRHDADLVRNSIGIQKGYLPPLAKMRFFWKKKDGKPAAFFRSEGDTWFWPGTGVMVRDRLLIFLMRIRTAKNDLGFQPCGWKAVLVTNPENGPSAWTMRYLNSPQKNDLIAGSGSAMVLDGFVHVFSTDWRTQKVYLMRWPLRSAWKGDLAQPQWWAGRHAGWVVQSPSGPHPRNVIAGGQMEFSVEFVPKIRKYAQIQTLSLLNPCLSICTAAALTGPWSARECLSPSPGGKGLLIYAGKSHPEIQGADMIFTYALNTRDEKRLLDDKSIYFPIVLRGWITMDQKKASGTAMAAR